MAVTKEELFELQKLVKELRERQEMSKKEQDGVLQASIEKYNQKVEDLQAKADEAYAELKAKEEKLADVTKRLEALEKMPDRKGRFITDTTDEGKQRQAEQKAAFIEFMRKDISRLSAEERKALVVNTDDQGGYLVPEDWRAEMMQAIKDISKMRTLCRVVGTTRDKLVVPKLNGSMTWSWVDESSLPTEQSAANMFGQITIDLHNAAGLITASQNLLEDSAFNIEQFIGDEFKSSLGLEEDDRFIGGTGQGQPEGVLTNLPASSIVTATAVNSVKVDDMLDLLYGLDEKYAAQATLLIRRGFAKHLRKQKSGDGQYLWQPSLQVGEPATFDGVPITQVTSTQLSITIATGNTVAVFGDWRYYWIVDRVEMSMQRLNEKYAPLIGFYFRLRRGGKRMLDEAFRSLKVG